MNSKGPETVAKSKGIGGTVPLWMFLRPEGYYLKGTRVRSAEREEPSVIMTRSSTYSVWKSM
ncbi:hypothetical protein CIHG_08262 [Coccidioides immitis H538.4]|uniref:Uncharacterized protein n=3 Tax=Coccidioides immitis TaxID=5501 RepID=A0A0J8QTG4_COCIT|nr:hypothetical protein CIRG_02325 [Coccidioides immitis RMSCC 2394]KMU74558.1 hypothetical protein CISG_04265 [Coccidioides immitis RMSCC 3703]KMU90547.1 hypothetical protein CIHG_08262 [Coccidioides immitis H538.4]